MGNLSISSINNTNVSEFIRRFPVIIGGNLLDKASEFESEYRFFNMTDGIPIELKAGDNDIFCKTKISEKDKWVRLDITDVRGGKSWYIQKKNGAWGNWVSITDQNVLDSAMNTKVDKVNGMGLSKNDFTDAYKSNVDSLVATNYFRGYFDTIAQIQALANPKNGWFGLVQETKTIWYYNTTWKDLGNTNTGDMKAIIYDPNNKKANVYDRANHDGQQAISTITNLQTELDSKVNKLEQIKVIDNCKSESPTDALSANQGFNIMSLINRVLAGDFPISFKSVFEETGYMFIGQGLINWGVVDFVDNINKTVEVNFRYPYMNKAFVVIATPVSNSSSGSGCDSCSAQIIDNEKFYLVKDYASNSNATKVQWFAFGY